MNTTTKPLTMTQEEIEAWEANDKQGRKIETFSYPQDENDPEGEADAFYVVEASRTAVEAMSDMARRKETTKKINEVAIKASVLAGPLEKLERDNALYYGLLGDITELGKVKKKRS